VNVTKISVTDETTLAPSIVVPPPGPRSRALAERLSRVENPAFDARREARAETSGERQAPIVYARAAGSNVFDVDGNRYLDLVCGFGACIFGHAPPFVAERVERAQRELWLALGDVYSAEAKVALLEELAALHPEKGARAILGLSGADAVTAALKTAMLATKKPGVVAFEGAYHGLSYAPLAACGLAPGFRAPFAAQLGDHVAFAPYPDASHAEPQKELDRALTVAERLVREKDAGAIIVEPVLGRGGCVVPPPGFLRGLRDVCTRAGALLVADEIWTGMGRAGGLLSSVGETTPDLICVGKALGAGVPISACIGSDAAMHTWGAHGGSAIHTATHFGAPSACVAALATLEALREPGVLTRARDVGERFAARVVNVTGRGMMIGVRVRDAAVALAAARRLLARGILVLTGGARGDVLTLTPALNVPEPLLEGAADAIAETLRDLEKKA
jgi:4-aminobutyrate aminotransferase/(S)-3-amino-2-methylpropionate transaminase